MCFFKLELTENADPHISQENGFSPVCVRMWVFKVELTEKADPQTSQENGFSPVCVCMSLSISEIYENFALYSSCDLSFSILFFHVSFEM